MEEGIFICTWSPHPDGYIGWVKNEPMLRVTSKSLDELQETLRRAVFDHLHCMHPVLEFDPPLPIPCDLEKFSYDDIVKVTGGDGFSVLEFPPGISERPFQSKIYWDTYFTSRTCHSCHTPTGIRNDLPLYVTNFSSESDAAFCLMGSGFRDVYSETFLGLFAQHELAGLQFRPIVRNIRARKKYLELIGPAGPPLVAVKQIKPMVSRCDDCGRKKFSYHSITDQPFHGFIQRSACPGIIPTIFTIGQSADVRLCLRRDRWQSIAGKRGTRGLGSSRIGICQDADVDPDPQ